MGCGSVLRQMVTAAIFALLSNVVVANEQLPKDQHGRFYFEFSGYKIALTTLDSGNALTYVSLKFPDTTPRIDGTATENQRGVWTHERILKEPDLFKKMLNEAALLYAGWSNEDEIKKYSRIVLETGEIDNRTSDVPLYLLTHLAVINKTIGTDALIRNGMLSEQLLVNENVRHPRNAFAERESRPDLVLRQPSHFEFGFEGIGRFYSQPGTNRMQASDRLFGARKDLFIYLGVLGGAEITKISDNQLVRASHRFSPKIHRKHWREIDLRSHEILKSIFIGPMPEGLE